MLRPELADNVLRRLAGCDPAGLPVQLETLIAQARKLVRETDSAPPPVVLSPPYTKLWIALDFDGTCVAHAYPEIGADIGAVPVLRRLCAEGAHLALWTMRSGYALQQAAEWCLQQGISIVAHNVRPADRHWTNSPKMSADMYIDDCGCGIPLLYDPALSHKPFVDWVRMERMLWPDNRGTFA